MVVGGGVECVLEAFNMAVFPRLANNVSPINLGIQGGNLLFNLRQMPTLSASQSALLWAAPRTVVRIVSKMIFIELSKCLI